MVLVVVWYVTLVQNFLEFVPFEGMTTGLNSREFIASHEFVVLYWIFLFFTIESILNGTSLADMLYIR